MRTSLAGGARRLTPVERVGRWPGGRDASWVRAQRLRAQGLALPTDRTPTEAVRLLAAVQSQEPAHAFWSLALRSTATTEGRGAGGVRRGRGRPHPRAASDLAPRRRRGRPLAARHHGRAGAPGQAPSAHRRGPRRRPTCDRGAAALADALADGAVLHPPRARRGARRGRAADRAARRGPAGHARRARAGGRERADARARAHVRPLRRPGAARSARTAPTPTRLLRRFLAGHGPASVARRRPLVVADPRSGPCRARRSREVGDELDDGRGGGGDVRLRSPRDRRPARACRRSCCCRSSTSCRCPTATWRFPPAPDHPHPPGHRPFVGSVVARRRQRRHLAARGPRPRRRGRARPRAERAGRRLRAARRGARRSGWPTFLGRDLDTARGRDGALDPLRSSP